MHRFAIFDPRPVGREANEAIITDADNGATLLGVEVTIPDLAARCGLGNLDHHGPNDTAETPSATEQALATLVVPPNGTTLVTVRADTDSVSAMAVLANLELGWDIDEKLVDAIGRFDRLGPSAGRPRDEVIAIGRVAQDFKITLAQRVTWVQYLLAGQGNEEEIRSIVADHDREFEAARQASEVTLHADSRIAAVVSTHRFATQIGYEAASVLVCFNPEMPVDFRDPSRGTYRKFTLCRYDCHVPVDLEAAMAELNALDTAVTQTNRWGGRGDIGGSTQGVSSDLTVEQVVEVVAKYLR